MVILAVAQDARYQVGPALAELILARSIFVELSCTPRLCLLRQLRTDQVGATAAKIEGASPKPLSS